VANVRRIRISVDVRHPFKLGSIGVTCADVACLELLELLLGAEFVGLFDSCQLHNCAAAALGTHTILCFFFRVVGSLPAEVEGTKSFS
jgi:hypothetical protein